MLKCQEVELRADALVDGTPLSRRERMALGMHLFMCRHCRRYVRQLRALTAHLRHREPTAAHDDQVQAVLDGVYHSKQTTEHPGSPLGG
jgi:anti-sigma factor ChrR (cupin superfamily)